MNKTTKFIRAISNLPSAESESFWLFFAQEAKQLSEDEKLRSGLCLAISDLRVGRSQPRPNISIRRDGMRLLSKDDLYKSILHQRERLVPFIDKYKHWQYLISCWILTKNLDYALEVLDALDCPHDKKGNRVEEQPPDWSPEEAAQRLMALSSHISFAELEIIAAGLFCNHEGWGYLEQAVDQLHEAAKQAKEAGEILFPVEPASMTTADASDDLATRLQALPGQIDTIVVYLQDIAAELQAGRLPDLTTIASTVELLQIEWTTLIAELRPTEPSLAGLRAALDAQKGRAEALALLDRLQRLRHREKPQFPGIATVRQRCAALRQRIAQTSCQDEAITAELKPLYTLERFIECYANIDQAAIDEAAIEELDTEIRNHFGVEMAIAATFRRLEFAELDIVTDEASETVVASTDLETAAAPVDMPASPEPAPIVDLEPPTPAIIPGEEAACDDPPSSTSEEQTVVTQEAAAAPPDEPNADDDKPPAVDTVPQSPHSAEANQSTSVQPIDEVQINASLSPIKPANGWFNQFDDRLRSFEAFCSAFWLDPAGEVVEAPWYQKDQFVRQITSALNRVLDQYEFGKAFLFMQTLDRLGQSSGWILDDWLAANAISESPESISAGLSDDRANRLQKAVKQQQTDDDLRLTLFLEAVRPSQDYPYKAHDLVHLVRNAPFDDPNLAEVISGLFRSNAISIASLQILSTQLADGVVADQRYIETNLSQRCRQLQTSCTQYANVAGPRMQKHCQRAWKRFMDQEIQPLKETVLQANQTGQWADFLPDLGKNLQRMIKYHNRIMDSGGVFLKDRIVTDRVAGNLERDFQEVMTLAEKLLSMTHSSTRAPIPIPIEAAHKLLKQTQPLQPVEELCRQLLRWLINQGTGCRPLRLDARFLYDCPSLLGEIKPDALRKSEIGEGLPLSAFRQSRLALATLLIDQPIASETLTIPDDLLFDKICERALEAQREHPYLLSAAPHLLESADLDRLHRFASKLGDDIFQAAQTLKLHTKHCQDLIVPLHEFLEPVVKDVENRANLGITSAGLMEGLLLKSWINHHLIEVATTAKEKAIDSYRQAMATQNPALLNKFEDLVNSNELRQIPLLLNSDHALINPLLPELRRTPWRTEKQISEFTDSSWIDDIEQRYQDNSNEMMLLVNSWLSVPNDHNSKQQLRSFFYNFISGEQSIHNKRRRRLNRKSNEGVLRIIDNQAVRIQCTAVRNMFLQYELNPTFLPQLADYAEIVLLSPPAVKLGGSGIATDWIGHAARIAGENTLVVFLAPKLKKNSRAEILSAFRTRNVSAAVIDDFDFWRLTMVDDSLGHDFVPFLEIVMEQLKLERVSPFSSQDGQHVRMETYVGRKEQAESLAKTAHYTRVFSGRKLGKSALLKYVEAVYDLSTLPSGNQLNVLFVTIAGGDSDRSVVDPLIKAMSERFDLAEPPAALDLPPSERFSQYVTSFIEQRPQDSLLIILDEADLFVERELANYDRDREKSLSFRMMKELPARVDKNRLPRVRIILSGYRETHRREGVWANAGDVLRLSPLQPEEAINFIQGALARLGVDITEHASFIARRCGFQPAILIRFGQSLLARLKTLRSPQRLGEYIAVSADDVSNTFKDAAILEEIRTVVSNNFQGNRQGGVIFDALLLAMQELPPGFPLENAPQRILDKLKHNGTDTDWLSRIDPNPEEEIKRHLRDFIERELLIEESGLNWGEAYRLKFPHYLPVLTQQIDLSLKIKQRIHELMQTQATQGQRLGGSILTDSRLSTIRFWHDQKDTQECQLVLVGGGWLGALSHEKVGIADRLGYSPKDVCTDARRLRATVKNTRVYARFNQAACVKLAGLTAQPAIVLGGVDTLRWALVQEQECGEFLIEIVPIRRIIDPLIAWWFETVRALHFDSPDAITRIAAITGGIPFLLERFDALLPHIPATEVTITDLQDAQKAFDSQFTAFAEQLRSGESTVCLTSREIELLTLLALIAEQGLTTRLGQDFSENWQICKEAYQDEAAITPPYAVLGDDLALQVLINAGFLSIDNQQQQPVQLQHGGVESRLVQAWRSHVTG